MERFKSYLTEQEKKSKIKVLILTDATLSDTVEGNKKKFKH